MLIHILNFDFSNISIESKKFYVFIAASIIFIVAIISIVTNENKNNRKKDSLSNLE